MNERKIEIVNLLRNHRVQHRFVNYGIPLITIDAVASQNGIVREQLVKAILLREKKQKRYVMACVSGYTRVNPQAVREQVLPSWRRLTFASTEEIQSVTGYTRGAVSPLCLPKEIPVIFDIDIVMRQHVNIGSGDPAVGLELSAQDLVKLAQPQVAPIAEPEVVRFDNHLNL